MRAVSTVRATSVSTSLRMCAKSKMRASHVCQFHDHATRVSTNFCSSVTRHATHPTEREGNNTTCRAFDSLFSSPLFCQLRMGESVTMTRLPAARKYEQLRLQFPQLTAAFPQLTAAISAAQGLRFPGCTTHVGSLPRRSGAYQSEQHTACGGRVGP